MTKNEIEMLLYYLKSARIYAGAEFERLCNENNHAEAIIFQNIRDNLEYDIQIIKDYYFIKNGEDAE